MPSHRSAARRCAVKSPAVLSSKIRLKTIGSREIKIDREALVDSEEMPRKRLAVVGCGPKALAIAAKADVLRELGIANIEIVIFEKNEVAANWTGIAGFTDGAQTLGTPPQKDVGFPYRSDWGFDVDRLMLSYSWQAYLIESGRYGSWVDRGRGQPVHRDWGAYLSWVSERVSASVEIGEVVRVKPLKGKVRLTLDDTALEKRALEFDGIVFTGPGRPMKIHDDPKHKWNEYIVNGRNFWQRIAIFSAMSGGDVALVGSGETAASIVVALMKVAPQVDVHIINRHGTLYTRGESYHENKFFTDPRGWEDLDIVDREEFMRRTDRGVFSVAAKQEIDQSSNIHLLTGNVVKIRKRGGKVEVGVQRVGPDREYRMFSYTYDRVIVAIGFDPFTPFSVFPDHLTPQSYLKTVRYGIDEHLRIPPFETKSDESDGANIHMPMLAGLAQGPGFPNLSSLGLLSDRILSAYVASAEEAESRKGSIADSDGLESSGGTIEGESSARQLAFESGEKVALPPADDEQQESAQPSPSSELSLATSASESR